MIRKVLLKTRDPEFESHPNHFCQKKILALDTGILPGAHDRDFWPWPRFPGTGSKTSTLALHQPVPMGTFPIV